MRRRNTLRLSITTILFALLTTTGCQRTTERGNDPWVFRSVLDWQPRMITFALGENFWISYNTDRAELYRVWADGVSFEGPVYNQSHGPQPVSLGRAWVSEKSEKSAWRLEVDGQQLLPSVRYRGHRYVDEHAEIIYDLAFTDGTIATVVELPERSGSRTLVRTFETTGLPDGANLLLSVNATSLADSDSYSTDGSFSGMQARNDGFTADLTLNPNGSTTLELTFTETPPIETIIQQPGAADESDLPEGLVLINASDCSICHNATVATVGPSYAQVAERYVNSAYNTGVLANKVVQGGSGNWGNVEMTAHPDISREEAIAMAEYILSLDGEPVADEVPTGRDSYPIDHSFGENPDRHGVVMNAYRFSEPVREMPVGIESYDPVFSGVVAGVYAPTNADFGDLDEDFYLEATGNIIIPETANYVFRLISDDGAFLYLDGKEIINNDGLHGPRPIDGEVFLEEGEHPFKITFFQGAGGKALALQWIKHGEEAFSRVPTEAFRYDPEDLKETKPFVPTETFKSGIPGDGVALEAVHPSFNLETIRPESFQPMVGGLDVMSDGRVVVSSWEPDGGVYMLENVGASSREQIKVTKIASGLLEPLGLKVVNDEIFVLQKHELTKLVDTDSDGLIDFYETVCAGWGVSSNFHEFAFGLVYSDGHFYATLATAILPGGASADPQVQDRGRVVKIDPETGNFAFVSSGLRTPNGIGIGVDGEIFVSDNQGDWLPSSKILHVSDGAFFGSRSVDFVGTANTREKPPVVWLPQDEIGNSPSQPALLDVGPYEDQMIHGEVTHGGIKRVFVEEVGGEYQGAVFRFIQGLEAGVNRIVWGPDGNLYVGGIGNPGNWGQDDKKWYGLQRLTYNGESAFEMLSVSARANGFEVEFTEPIAKEVPLNPQSFAVTSWRYEPTADYGGPKIDEKALPIRALTLSADRKRALLEVSGLSAGTVVHVYIRDPLASETGRKLWTTEAWYTLNNLSNRISDISGERVTSNQSANTLTPSETEEGWQLLFDGITTKGWRNYGSSTLGSDWKVKNGTLELSGAQDGWQIADGGDIITEKEFQDFDLRLEWKISEGGNSGIFFNVIEDTSRFSYPWESGPEMQILDDDVHSDGKHAKHRSGDLYDMIGGPATPTRPVGQWNRVRILQRDGHVQQWLNDHLMAEYRIGTNEWDELVSKSKFGTMDGFGTAISGRIGLQDHGNTVAFRNIKIREL